VTPDPQRWIAWERARALYEQYAWTNALLEVDFDRVRAELERADGPSAPGPGSALAGSLFSVKDTFATAGIRSTAGSLVLRDNIPVRDAVVVERLRHRGAVLVGKGNCAEFGFGVHTENRIGGRVHHPFDPTISPGGSSGGDAVAVAIGVADFALGSDYGGSVRWPAQSVGILGLRTGVGQVPRTGQIPGAGGQSGATGPPVRNPWSLAGMLETVGIFARSTERIAEVFGAIRGPDHLDSLTQRVGTPLRGAMAPSAHRRIGVTDGREILGGRPEVRAAMDRLRLAAKACDLEVVEVAGLLEGAFETYTNLRRHLDHHVDVRAVCAGAEQLLCAETRQVLAGAGPDRAFGPAWPEDWARREEICGRVRQLLGEVDAIVLPVAPTGPVPFAARPLVDGQRLDANQLMSYCRAVSLTGLPALSIPFDLPATGHGVSLQIVGPDGGEERCCQLAAQLGGAAGLPWASSPSPG
jgi:amidase